eukprot:3249894-Prymnesium_polylepis.1
MSAHEQDATAQTRHSKRWHTCPSTFHGLRARNIPAHALASPRLAVAHTRSDTSSPPCPTPALAIELLHGAVLVSKFSFARE